MHRETRHANDQEEHRYHHRTQQTRATMMNERSRGSQTESPWNCSSGTQTERELKPLMISYGTQTEESSFTSDTCECSISINFVQLLKMARDSILNFFRRRRIAVSFPTKNAGAAPPLAPPPQQA